MTHSNFFTRSEGFRKSGRRSRLERPRELVIWTGVGDPPTAGHEKEKGRGGLMGERHLVPKHNQRGQAPTPSARLFGADSSAPHPIVSPPCSSCKWEEFVSPLPWGRGFGVSAFSSISMCGSAALSCGKALPLLAFTIQLPVFRRGCASPVEAQPQPRNMI